MESQEKIEETMKCLEERINDKIKEQKVEFDIEIQEVENRMIQRTMEELDWMKEYVDSSMTQRIEVIKSGTSELARQFDRRFQELDKVETRNNEKYKILEEKVSDIYFKSNIVVSMEEKINELSNTMEIMTKEKMEKRSSK